MTLDRGESLYSRCMLERELAIMGYKVILSVCRAQPTFVDRVRYIAHSTDPEAAFNSGSS